VVIKSIGSMSLLSDDEAGKVRFDLMNSGEVLTESRQVQK
jgi:hypothetical protein